MAINRKTVVGAIDPDVLAFTEGKDPILDLALAQWDCIGTAAHVTMLSRMEVAPAIFSREERNAVVAELREIIQDAKEGRFCITAEDNIGTAARHVGRDCYRAFFTCLRYYFRFAFVILGVKNGMGNFIPAKHI